MASDETAQTPPLVAAAEEAFTRAHARSADHAATVRSAWLTEWLEAFESEHSGFAASVLTEALDRPDMPPALRAALAPLRAPEHQTQVILGLFAVSQIVSQFIGAVLAPYIRDAASFSWSHDQTMPLSPAEAALAQLKGVWDEATAMHEASLNGIAADRYTTLRLITGEPLALQELLLLFRRGQITEAELEHGIRQSRVRDEWIPFAKELRYAPVGPGEVLAGAVQGHLTTDDAAHRIAEAGVNPDDFTWLYETHGRPPGAMEMLHLLNRNKVSEGDVIGAIRESDIKNKYIPAILELRRYLPPPRTVLAMLRQGALTPTRGTELLLENGLTPDDAAVYVKEATATRHSAMRELAETQIRELYEARLITHADATQMLLDLHYDEHSAAFLLALADHARHARFQNAAIARVHAQYEAHRIDRVKASALLDSIGVDPAARDDLIALWKDELAANVPRLNLSQLQGALRRNLITLADFDARCEQLGWAKADLHVLAAEAFPPGDYPGAKAP